MLKPILDIIAVYFFSIITIHVFSDDNKHSGLIAYFVFVKLNNYQPSPIVTKIISTNFILWETFAQLLLKNEQVWINATATSKTQIYLGK